MHMAPMGRERGTGKRYCCRHPECRGKGHEECCEHTFVDCPPAKRAMDAFLDRWEKRTGEVVERDDLATRLMGDRKVIGDDVRPELEEPFITMHAMLMTEIWKARTDYVFHMSFIREP